MDENRRRALSCLGKSLGYRFRDLSLLHEALTHGSYVHERVGQDLADNERLEFLGDAVLELCITDILLARYPDHREGPLSKGRSAVVNEQVLAILARQYHLGDYLLLGKGEDASGGRFKTSILANTLEAVVAAVYRDGGYPAAQTLIRAIFLPLLPEGEPSQPHRDYKTCLQELCLCRFKTIPNYALIGDHGPDHAKTFHVRVSLDRGILATGQGRSKKEAEQEAAREALRQFQELRAEAKAPPP
jgi:ribonuclease III